MMVLIFVFKLLEVGKYYEVFVVINDGVVFFCCLDIQFILNGIDDFIKFVVDYDDPDCELGVVDG